MQYIQILRTKKQTLLKVIHVLINREALKPQIRLHIEPVLNKEDEQGAIKTEERDAILSSLNSIFSFFLMFINNQKSLKKSKPFLQTFLVNYIEF